MKELHIATSDTICLSKPNDTQKPVESSKDKTPDVEVTTKAPKANNSYVNMVKLLTLNGTEPVKLFDGR